MLNVSKPKPTQVMPKPSTPKALHRGLAALAVAATVLAGGPLAAQFPGLTTPPGGDNQKSVVTQYMGFASVTVTYNSPDVTSPTGEDRTGKIWGQLVPFGMSQTGFGNGLPSPWRAGSNENTTLEVSHDVEVEGKPLAAGKYGLHMIPGESEWTVIFSNNHHAWGSFFYDPAEDALRVTVKPEAAEFREWLTFDALDRQLDSTVIALHWEKLRVPFRISIPNIIDRYVDIMGQELTGSPGFSWQNWNAATQFLINRDTEGKYNELALQWADSAISAPFIGRENFQTLTSKAQVLRKLGRTEETFAVLDKAIGLPSTTTVEIHQLGRTLLTMGEKERALEIFKKNLERFDGVWPTHVGMARGLSAVGRYDEAMKHAKIALEQAPDDLNRGSLEGMIETLAKGQDVN